MGFVAGQNFGSPTSNAAATTDAAPALAQVAAATSNESAPAENLNVSAAEAASTQNIGAAGNTVEAGGETSPAEMNATAESQSANYDEDFRVRTGLADPPSSASTASAPSGIATEAASYVSSEAGPAPSASPPTYAYSAPPTPYSSPPSKCESVGCYGEISTVTGLPRTTYVHGYFRSNGTYVRPYYRSHR